MRNELNLLEDLTIINNGHAAALTITEVHEGAESIAESERQARLVQGVTVVLQKHKNNQQLVELRNQLNETAYKRNEVIAALNASSDTIKSLIQEIAQLKKQSVEEVRLRVDIARTLFYEQEVDEFIRDGYLVKDPRLDHANQWSWYTP